MAKITCDIVKDLIPLYVDNVLSGDSKKLVEEHLQSCEECREYNKAISEGAVFASSRSAKEKALIKKIKNKINYKRLATACITAVVVAAISFSAFYVGFVREYYLPYDDSGVYVENNTIKTRSEYQCFYGFDDPEEEGIFYMYLSTTPYHEHQEKDGVTEMLHINDRDDTTRKIYYIPKEYVDDFKNYPEGLTDEVLKDVKESAPLLWSEN